MLNVFGDWEIMQWMCFWVYWTKLLLECHWGHLGDIKGMFGNVVGVFSLVRRML